jgi:hypothetical protein
MRSLRVYKRSFVQHTNTQFYLIFREVSSTISTLSITLFGFFSENVEKSNACYGCFIVPCSYW